MLPKARSQTGATNVAGPSPATEPSVEEQPPDTFFTPGQRVPTLYSNPLYVPMPNLPEIAPQFKGEKGVDDLHAWLGQAKLCFFRVSLMCRGNPNVTEADIVQVFSLLAFEEDTPARFWYEANQDRLLQNPLDGKTTYEH